MQIQANAKLLFVGDSITDCGRARPVGQGGGLGDGYVKMVQALLASTYPDRMIQVLNTGVSGSRVPDLASRCETEVPDLQPDWLSVMIGTNDVWRQFDNPANPAIHVLPDRYEATLDRLVEQAKPVVQGMVLMTPFFIEPNRQEPMRARMDEYGTIVKKVAESRDCLFVDTQAAFDEALKHVHPYAFAGDRVHPNPAGHMILARAFLKAVGFEW